MQKPVNWFRSNGPFNAAVLPGAAVPGPGKVPGL